MYHREMHTSDVMKGSPPPLDKRVTLENWTYTTDKWRWTHLNAHRVFRTAKIDRGIGPTWVLPRKMVDPDELHRAKVLWGATKEKARKISVGEWLQRNEIDSLVALVDGHIAAEIYTGEMTPQTPHNMWCGAKSVITTVMAPCARSNRRVPASFFIIFT